MGCGVGITSIFVNQHCSPRSLLINDYNSKVLANARGNLKLNGGSEEKIQIMEFDWREYKSSPSLQNRLQNMQVILGSDIIYAGTPFEDLIHLVLGSLGSGGLFILQISSDRHKK